MKSKSCINFSWHLCIESVTSPKSYMYQVSLVCVCKAMSANGIQFQPRVARTDVECECMEWDLSQRCATPAKAYMHKCSMCAFRNRRHPTVSILIQGLHTSAVSCEHLLVILNHFLANLLENVNFWRHASVKRHRLMGGSNTQSCTNQSSGMHRLENIIPGFAHWPSDIDKWEATTTKSCTHQLWNKQIN